GPGLWRWFARILPPVALPPRVRRRRLLRGAKTFCDRASCVGEREPVIESQRLAGAQSLWSVAMKGKRRHGILASHKPRQRRGAALKANPGAPQRAVVLARPFHPARPRAVHCGFTLEPAFRRDVDRCVTMVVEQLSRTAELQPGVVRTGEPAQRVIVAERE